MTLARLIAQLDQLDDDLVLYAEPRWRASSRAVALPEPDDGTQPELAIGMTYLVDVAQAKRIVAMCRTTSGGDDPLELCRSVIYYAIYDQIEPPPSTADLSFALA
jgi:hypothetical protein